MRGMRLRRTLLYVTLVVAVICAAASICWWGQHQIMEIERDAMRQYIIENELQPPYRTDRLDSEYAHLLLGDEVDSLKAEQQRRKEKNPLSRPDR
jgi:hypothetical protein